MNRIYYMESMRQLHRKECFQAVFTINGAVSKLDFLYFDKYVRFVTTQPTSKISLFCHFES